MPNEASVHAQEYGFGGPFFEDELFDTDDEEDYMDMKPMMKPEWGGSVLKKKKKTTVIAFQKGGWRNGSPWLPVQTDYTVITVRRRQGGVVRSDE